MKLEQFEIKKDYIFMLKFENGITRTIDLSDLIKSKVKPEEIKTAHIDKDWGCLEFNDGMVDISPKTLYNYCK